MPQGDVAGHKLRINQNPHNEADLHSEFRGLLSLLTFVTAVNNMGHSTLHHRFIDDYKALFDRSAPEMGAIIQALSAVLVRDYRVVAVALPNSHYHPSTSFGHGGSSLQAYVMQDENGQFRGHKATVLTPIENAGTKQYRQTSDSLVITKGVSHFDLISNDNWKCLTIP